MLEAEVELVFLPDTVYNLLSQVKSGRCARDGRTWSVGGRGPVTVMLIEQVVVQPVDGPWTRVYI